MHDDINIFKTVNNDHVTFPMSYKILKYSFWILHLTNYKEHFKSRSTKLRTINLAQCPQFTVMKIVRNLTFSLTRKGKLHPQIHTFFNQKSNKHPPLSPNTLTRLCEPGQVWVVKKELWL